MTEKLIDRIDHEIVVNAPIGRVWELLTAQDYVAKWYAFDGAEIDLRPGGRVAFRWNDHGEFFGQVERVSAPFEFVFRFAGHDPGEAPRPDNSTVVKFSLEATSGETRVCVVESGFSALAYPKEGAIPKSEISLEGWRGGLSALASLAQRL